MKGLLDPGTDLVVFVLDLPGIGVSDVVRLIRLVSGAPVLMATTRADATEVGELVGGDTDLCLSKPFSSEDFAARINTLLHRIDVGQNRRLLNVGGIRIDLSTRQITVEGSPIPCTRKEFDLLAYLAARPGRIISKEELYIAVWKEPYGRQGKTIDVHLSWLRRKLGETAATPRYLHTIRGVGVKLVDPS